MDDEIATASDVGVARVFDLHALKAFAPERRVRKMLFKTDQLWSEIACYEPGQSTVMHTHPREEEDNGGNSCQSVLHGLAVKCSASGS